MNEYEKRFTGIARLYGSSALEVLKGSHVTIIGLGGVGSWSAESLARSGIGELSLVDLDDVCVSNINRQIHALTSKVGDFKVDALKERLLDINPEIKINTLKCFFNQKNMEEIFQANAHGIIDAMDDLENKCLLIKSVANIRDEILVVTGGTGGKTDPTMVQVADINKSFKDPLCFSMRKKLRREHGFARNKKPYGVDCVFSPQDPVFPQKDGTVSSQLEKETKGDINCANGLGSVSHLTGTFGLTLAHQMVKRLIDKYDQ